MIIWEMPFEANGRDLKKNQNEATPFTCILHFNWFIFSHPG